VLDKRDFGFHDGTMEIGETLPDFGIKEV
jgi:hypothetical protein